MPSPPLKIHRNPSLPQQAWLLHVSDAAELWCGDSVQTRPDGFFEGAWAGALDKFDFANSANVFGSGATFTPRGWLLVPPSHTLEALYLLQLREGGWLASNSIAFLNQHTNIGFQASDARFYENFTGIVNGIERSPSRISFPNGEFFILNHHNALLSPDGLIVQRKPLPPDFQDFEGYRDYLAKTLSDVTSNAADSTRRKTYKLLTSISSGYDSPACASIARAAGCTEAISIAKSRDGDPDDGAEIARQLGLSSTAVVERPDSAGATRESAAEFYATGMQAVDIIFEVLRGRLAGRIFVTGFQGDKVWDLRGKANPILERADISGSSLGEFRLSEGFIHLPMAFIGALRHASVSRISNSAEMKAFSIGGSYDRPIPRRIAEESGASRTAFGQEKKAIVTLVHMKHSRLAEKIRSEIELPLRAWPAGQRLEYRVRAAWFAVLGALIYEISYLLPIGQGFYERTMGRLLLRGRYKTFEHFHPFNALALDWALRLLGRRYACVSSVNSPG